MRRKQAKWWLEAAAVLILALILAGASYYLNPPPPQSALEPASVEPAAPQASALEPIDIEQAQELHQAGALFLDTRGQEAFAAGRIPGARPYSPGGPPPSDSNEVVLYGQGPDLDQVLAAAEELASRTGGPVYIFIEGLDGWLAWGESLEKGALR